MTALDANTFRDLETRHAHLLHRSFRQRFGGLMVLGGILLYCIYSAWFFDLPKLVPKVIGSASASICANGSATTFSPSSASAPTARSPLAIHASTRWAMTQARLGSHQ